MLVRVRARTSTHEREAHRGVRVDLSIDDARTAATAWAPDVIVSEGLDGVGPVLAREQGVPHVTVSLGPVCSQEIDGGVRDHLRAFGHDAAPTDLRLDPWPAALRPPGWIPPGPATPIRPELGLSAASGPPPAPLPAGDDPCVLLTLGTLFSSAEAVQPLLDALGDAGLQVVCALGPTVDPSTLRNPAPDRVDIRPFGPLDAVLPSVDAVVCHGGAATLLSALSHGRPVIVLPLGADHVMNADGVRAAGVGRVIEEIDASAVAAAAREVVADAGTVAAARDLGATIAAMPSPDAVVPALEALSAR